MLTVACATDDGLHFVKRHFGDAKQYAVYEVDAGGFRHVQTIDNITVGGLDPEGHGDVLKAKHVMMFLKQLFVQVLVNKNFGPNINRMVIRFLPVITKHDDIEKCLTEIAGKIDIVEAKLHEGSERKPLYMD